MRCLYAAQLSDKALKWLTDNAVIITEQRSNAVEIFSCISVTEQRSNAVEIFSCISVWLEGAAA
jgi:hypothetical protein